MKKLLLCVVALASLVSPAMAADTEMTVEQALNVSGALTRMSCGERVIKDGAKESMVCEPYKWSTGITWSIAGNADALKRVAAQYMTARNQMVASLPRDKEGKVTAEAEAKFAVADRELLDQRVKITLEHFKRTDLEPMNLRPDTISALMPIIDF